LGRIATFGTDGDGRALLDWGWGEPERWGVPTEGPVAVLSLRPEKAAKARPLRLTAALRRTSGRDSDLSLAVRANGKPVSTWRLAAGAERGSFEVDLPPELLRLDDGGVTLELSVAAADGTGDAAADPGGPDLDLGLESLLLRAI
jgi:hypothetical protein